MLARGLHTITDYASKLTHFTIDAVINTINFIVKPIFYPIDALTGVDESAVSAEGSSAHHSFFSDMFSGVRIIYSAAVIVFVFPVSVLVVFPNWIGRTIGQQFLDHGYENGKVLGFLISLLVGVTTGLLFFGYLPVLTALYPTIPSLSLIISKFSIVGQAWHFQFVFLSGGAFFPTDITLPSIFSALSQRLNAVFNSLMTTFSPNAAVGISVSIGYTLSNVTYQVYQWLLGNNNDHQNTDLDTLAVIKLRPKDNVTAVARFIDQDPHRRKRLHRGGYNNDSGWDSDCDGTFIDDFNHSNDEETEQKKLKTGSKIHNPFLFKPGTDIATGKPFPSTNLAVTDSLAAAPPARRSKNTSARDAFLAHGAPKDNFSPVNDPDSSRSSAGDSIATVPATLASKSRKRTLDLSLNNGKIGDHAYKNKRNR